MKVCTLLQSLKGNPHIFLIPRHWLVGRVPDSLWRLFNKLVETLLMDLLFCASCLELWNNLLPSASKLQGVTTFNWKVIIEIPCAKTFQTYPWWPTKSLVEIRQSCILEYPILQCDVELAHANQLIQQIPINHNYQFMKITSCEDTKKHCFKRRRLNYILEHHPVNLLSIYTALQTVAPR